MRQIIVVLLLAFVFFGCNQKQVVQLKMPGQNKIVKQQPVVKQVDEDTVTVVEEFTPVEVLETDVKEQIMNNNGSQNFFEIDGTKAKITIAFVYPSMLSKYAKGSIGTISAYLDYQKSEYNLVVIDTVDESSNSIEGAFAKLKEENIDNIIALFSPKAISSLNQVANGSMKVYLPLIEKKESLENNDNLIFGSISYEDQLKKLSYYSNGKNAMFYQDTYLSRNVKKAYDNVITNSVAVKEVSNSEKNFKNLVVDSRIRNSSLLLNLDLVKSALILSQLRANDVYPNVIFATQANFDLNILTLTQDKDREKLIVANSIAEVDVKLKDAISTFGGNITFDWVDYSSLVGANYLYYGGNSTVIPTKIEDNQATYETRLFKATAVGFSEIK